MCKNNIKAYIGSQAPWVYKSLQDRRIDSMKHKIRIKLNPKPLNKEFIEKEIIRNSINYE